MIENFLFDGGDRQGQGSGTNQTDHRCFSFLVEVGRLSTKHFTRTLRQLIRCGGDVETGPDGGVTVRLSKLYTLGENETATASLNEINDLAPLLLGTDPIPIRFRLRD